MKRISWLIMFATLHEADETIRMFRAEQTAPGQYAFTGGKILLCGMGLEAASSAAFAAPIEGYRWLNIGLAGSLDAQISLGAVRSIKSVSLLDGSTSPIVIDPDGDTLLYSSPTPVYAAPEVNAALVDMEGYAIACAAKEKGAALSMRKVVSDYCSKSSHTDILDNMEFLSCRMAEEVSRILFPRACEAPAVLATVRL